MTVERGGQDIDYNDIRMWRNNPELILRTAKKYAYRWGNNYTDKEDLQMAIVEAILKAIEKFDPNRGTTLNGHIWISAKRAVMDYGRKHGREFKGRDPKKRIYIRESEYHEVDETDFAEKKGYRLLSHARFVAAHYDSHENFDFIQTLKKESDLMKKAIFCFYFLEMTAAEIAEETGRSEFWVWKKIAEWKDKFYLENVLEDQNENYQNDNSRSSFSCLEDLPMEKLEDFYELIQKQSRVTRNLSTEN
jgi:RNA polymerase sigma factor (sigma-70 family)